MTSRRFASLVPSLAALLVVVALSPPAHAIALVGGLGGPGNNGGYGPSAGYGASGTEPLFANDDQSSPSIDISTAFPMGINFFGTTYKAMFLNTNGNITFKAALGVYTPNAFPVASEPMIAPFWADVDTRGGVTNAENAIWWYIELGRVVVTWSMVGYYSEHDDLLNDFQLILTASTCGTNDFDVEFRYNQCQWITGDASGGSHGFGGTPAQAGFDAGDSMNYVAIPGSLTAAILNLCTTSNVGVPGDYKFQIRGGQVAGGCTGGGMACDTKLMGACSAGINQCSGAGVVCNPVASPSPEKCDGIDNDCNGTVDDGDNLCSSTQICDQGQCVDVCFAEIGCTNPADVCTDRGSCVEADCAMVTCPVGERCKGGVCVQPCDGVVCPHDQVCRVGRCVDPCAGVTCGAQTVCVAGVCVPSCQCSPCGVGQTCQMSGQCVETACATVTCNADQYCMGGTCYFTCSGANCPDGQSCISGQCIDTPPDMTIVQDMAIVPDMATVPDLAGSSGSTTSGANGTNGGSHSKRSSTGCELAHGSDAPGGWLWLLSLLSLVAIARRRRLTH